MTDPIRPHRNGCVCHPAVGVALDVESPLDPRDVVALGVPTNSITKQSGVTMETGQMTFYLGHLSYRFDSFGRV